MALIAAWPSMDEARALLKCSCVPVVSSFVSVPVSEARHDAASPVPTNGAGTTPLTPLTSMTATSSAAATDVAVSASVDWASLPTSSSSLPCDADQLPADCYEDDDAGVYDDDPDATVSVHYMPDMSPQVYDLGGDWAPQSHDPWAVAASMAGLTLDDEHALPVTAFFVASATESVSSDAAAAPVISFRTPVASSPESLPTSPMPSVSAHLQSRHAALTESVVARSQLAQVEMVYDRTSFAFRQMTQMGWIPGQELGKSRGAHGLTNSISTQELAFLHSNPYSANASAPFDNKRGVGT
jgi:hypothetical protein